MRPFLEEGNQQWQPEWGVKHERWEKLASTNINNLRILPFIITNTSSEYTYKNFNYRPTILMAICE